MLDEAKADRLHLLLNEQAKFQLESRVAVSEVRSWQRSLPVLLADLADAGLSHVEVLLEHKLPHSPRRVDVVLCGTHPKTGDPSYVLVELTPSGRPTTSTSPGSSATPTRFSSPGG